MRAGAFAALWPSYFAGALKIHQRSCASRTHRVECHAAQRILAAEAIIIRFAPFSVYADERSIRGLDLFQVDDDRAESLSSLSPCLHHHRRRRVVVCV